MSLSWYAGRHHRHLRDSHGRSRRGAACPTSHPTSPIHQPTRAEPRGLRRHRTKARRDAVRASRARVDLSRKGSVHQGGGRDLRVCRSHKVILDQGGHDGTLHEEHELLGTAPGSRRCRPHEPAARNTPGCVPCAASRGHARDALDSQSSTVALMNAQPRKWSLANHSSSTSKTESSLLTGSPSRSSTCATNQSWWRTSSRSRHSTISCSLEPKCR